MFSRDMRNDARRIARGEYPVYITQVFALASDLKGLPVKVVIPREGAPYAQMDMAMLRERAASERRAPVHATFPQRRFAIGLRQWLDAAGGAGARPTRPIRTPSRSPTPS